MRVDQLKKERQSDVSTSFIIPLGVPARLGESYPARFCYVLGYDVATDA